MQIECWQNIRSKQTIIFLLPSNNIMSYCIRFIYIYFYSFSIKATVRNVNRQPTRLYENYYFFICDNWLNNTIIGAIYIYN